MSQQQYQETVAAEEEYRDWEPHKRPDYAERMYELAELQRDRQREEELIRSLQQ